MPGRIVRWIERRFVYFPERTLKGTPAHVGLDYEEVRFSAEDGVRLHGWWIPAPVSKPGSGPDGSGAPPRRQVAWLFCHGNGGNISAPLDNLLGLHRRLGAAIFTFDYRGYGLSEGVPTEEGTYLDARAALRELETRIGTSPGQVVYFGRSMGSAVASKLAIDRPPSALILESPPPSIPDVSHLHVPWMSVWPLKWVMRTRYETLRHIRSVHVPVLVLQGDSDRTVPARYARRVFEAANEPRRWVLLPGAGHDRADLADPDLYYGAVTSFLGEHLRAPPEPRPPQSA